MKKKKIVIAVVAVILVFVVAGGSVAAYVIKKASPYKKIIDAYNNTINADNFDVVIQSDADLMEEEYRNLEVYGKGDSTDDVIVTVFKGEEHTLENFYSMATGDKMAKMFVASNVKDYSDIKFLPIEDDYSKLLKASAKRDISTIYSDYLGLDKSTGISYDELYSAFFNTMLDYVSKNKESSAIKNINVSKDEFSMKVKPLELLEKLGDNSNFDYKKFATKIYNLDEWNPTKDLSWTEVKQMFNDYGLYWEITIKLNGKYLDSIRIDQKIDEKAFDEQLSMSELGDKKQYEEDSCLISVQFDNVNQLTDETSIGKQIMKNVK